MESPDEVPTRSDCSGKPTATGIFLESSFRNHPAPWLSSTKGQNVPKTVFATGLDSRVVSSSSSVSPPTGWPINPRSFFGMMDAMKRILFTAATSSWLIFLVALLARLGFAWYMERQVPRDVLAPASFAQETGSIAQSLATGKGFNSPFGKDTGPTAWLAPVYPLLVAAIFRVFGIFTRASFFAVVFLNALFSSAVCVA